VLRNGAIATGILIAALVAYQAIHVSDLERVEEEMERLFEAARRGGEEAADEIDAAFAGDYRGSGVFELDRVRRRIRSALVPAGTVTDLKHGDFQPVKKNDEIVVPIVRVQGDVRGRSVGFVVSVTWAKRDGAWRIVDISRWRMGE
jgi:hypothetical protein